MSEESTEALLEAERRVRALERPDNSIRTTREPLLF